MSSSIFKENTGMNHGCWRALVLVFLCLLWAAECILYKYLLYHVCALCIYTTVYICSGPAAMITSRPSTTMVRSGTGVKHGNIKARYIEPSGHRLKRIPNTMHCRLYTTRASTSACFFKITSNVFWILCYSKAFVT